MSVKDAIRTFQGWLGPLNNLPTWANEPLTAFVVMPLLLWVGLGWTALPLFLLVSHLYEVLLDPWGWSAEDVLWRAYGAVLVVSIYAVLR